MSVVVERIPGGFRVDSLDLKRGKCGCTSILACCYSWSMVKQSGNKFVFTAKTTGPDTTNHFNWGYVVKKGDYIVEVSIEDARDKKIFSGYYPPRLDEWIERGWEVAKKDGDREDLDVWRCAMCKWLYKNRKEEVPFDVLPDDWKCPVCKADKGLFEKVA